MNNTRRNAVAAGKMSGHSHQHGLILIKQDTTRIAAVDSIPFINPDSVQPAEFKCVVTNGFYTIRDCHRSQIKAIVKSLRVNPNYARRDIVIT